MGRSSASEAFVACEAIAADRALASKPGDFADGYRAAANDIVAAIRAKREGRPPTPLERDLREAEIEARTLARVVAVASNVVAGVSENACAADAVRDVLAHFFHRVDLPPELRPRTAEESGPRLNRARKGAA
jgi:hypothetical protein